MPMVTGHCRDQYIAAIATIGWMSLLNKLNDLNAQLNILP